MYNVKLYPFFLLSILLCRTATADTTQNIDITNAWISEAPPTVTILAGYFDITNNSNREMTLKAASSPHFSRVEIHLSVTKDDMVSMEKQDALAIPAGETLKLTPGSYHLMLFDPNKAIRAGDTATISLSFAGGHTQTVEANIERRGHQSHHAHHH